MSASAISPLLASSGAFADAEIEEINVTGGRLPVLEVGQSVTVIDTQIQPALRLDEVLKQVPGVGLFRRANSLTAHPTTQGLSLRGVGANAAGRVLVTLDGVPLNNPFGGWIYWSSIDPRSIGEARVLKGGSASAFGPQALAGTVALTSFVPEETGGFVSAEYGAFESYSLNGAASIVGDKGYITFEGGYFETDGAFLLSEEQRGPIDVRAASDAERIGVRGAYELSEATDAFFTVRYYGENRTNGLTTALNETDGVDASLRLVHDAADGPDWEVVAYYRTNDFSNIFSSARDERTTERPVLNQFDVPGSGGGILARLKFDALEVGIEGRRASGETNELFRNLGDGFTRLRVAGGDQWTIGVFADYLHEASWGELSVSTRLDRYRTYNGSRVETNIEDGSEVRNDDVPNQGDFQFSGRVGLRHEISPAVDLKAAAYRSWRLPTINEFYRPFRVVNDITEANPNLVPEKLYGFEIGLDYEPLNTVRGSFTYYRNWLEDGVGNVTVAFGPGFFPLGGFVPAGGVLRQRANIDRTRIDGFEVNGEVDVLSNWTLIGRYQYADAEIVRFAGNPDLIGNRPVQTPRHVVYAAARHTNSLGWLTLEARYSSGQFDDDLNERRLDDIFTVNANIGFKVTDSITLTGAIENLFDAEVISGVTTTGLETIAQRRFWRIGVEARF
ncbi:TonB-dependent receptor [Kordiimonas sp. SCSIO 12610]|uniref:TonB-dependent receptor n=1 Tax=Kordiimonas sp. SCSIO 12610 TaxID=2829597 RepID=UPI00210EB705|nr:TonB-dependent receptor [Kordiimonas sp. SCSIO 12610]UTW55970.1 TonB-dependent receptor [Kordiimonas sp. SCSIO 12610]